MIFSKSQLWVGCLLLFFCLSAVPSLAQNKYWVVLKDKQGVRFDPYSYFNKKAIERRQNQHLPLFEETDKPLNPKYLKQVTALSDSVTGSSRWLNAVACYARPEQVKALQELTFVREIIPFRKQQAVL